MEFQIPIQIATKNPKRWNTALHLIAVFTLLITGGFLLLYQNIWQRLPETERQKLTELTVAPWKCWLLLAAGVMLQLSVLFAGKWLQQKPVNRIVRVLELLLIGTLAGLAFWQQIYMPGILYSMVCGLIVYSFYQDTQINRVPEVLVDAKGVQVPLGALSRQIKWPEIERVLLKHGVLTIDCLDNRLYQWNILKAERTDMGAFQEFCQQQIEQAIPLRRKDDW